MELEKYKSSLMLQDGANTMSAMKLQYSQPLAIEEDPKRGKNKQSAKNLKQEIGNLLK
jgi:hypothetical protein